MTTETKTKTPRPIHTAHQRAQAVLSVWTQRRRPSEVCKELTINSTVLSQWQERAMEGMLAALAPKTRPEAQRGPALTHKLERLLSRKTLAQEGKLSKLEKRLSQLQQQTPSVAAK